MHRRSAPLLALCLGVSLSSCSAEAETSQAARPAPTVTYTAGDVPVLVPGAPGDEPVVVEPGETGTVANADAYGDADVAFVTSMVGHHAQALEMAELAPDRAEDERVLRLAERIAAGQAPEIEAMQSWLEQHGLPAAPTDGGHAGHGKGVHDDGAQGMASPEDLTRLVAARGRDFDRLFLELMTRHHEGALRMAEDAIGASHPLVSEMVDDTVATQSVEIQRMQTVLADL